MERAVFTLLSYCQQKPAKVSSARRGVGSRGRILLLNSFHWGHHQIRSVYVPSLP